jgi:hypothetical protein
MASPESASLQSPISSGLDAPVRTGAFGVKAERTPAAENIPRLVAVLILAAILLVPIWSVAFPPLLDYPNHLARSFVLAHLADPAYTFSRFYRADWGAYP